MRRFSGKDSQSQDGAVAVWFALTLVLFFAFAALIVDVSEFFDDAVYEQTAADLACRAGAQSLANLQNLPVVREQEGFLEASRSITLNVDAYQGSDATLGATTMRAGNPWTADEFRTRMAWDSANDTFTVELEQTVPTTFGKVLGVNDVEVDQRAVCQLEEGGISDLPFGVVSNNAGEMNSEQGDCNTSPGNCHQLSIPRVAGSPQELTLNIIHGVEPRLEVWDGTDDLCVAGSTTCNQVSTDSGFDQGPLSNGLIHGPPPSSGDGRLTNLAEDATPFVTPNKGVPINDDAFGDVVQTVGPPHTGTVVLVDTMDYTGPPPPLVITGLPEATHIARCDHPRLSRTPVLLDFPNGTSSKQRIAGFVFQFIGDPDDGGDLQGADNVTRVNGTPFVLASGGATCEGPNGSVHPLDPHGRYASFQLVE